MGLRQRTHREMHQRKRIVVARDAVEVHHVAAVAAVDEHPFTIRANADSHGLHRARAVDGVAVARYVVVEVLAPRQFGQ
jgi:hypothetical protein